MKDIDSIVFHMNDQRWRYEPRTDIRPLDAARLAVFFMGAATPQFAQGVDLWAYVNRYNLLQHFVEVPS